MELTYRKCGDYYLPNVRLPEQPKDYFGIFGEKRREYLREHHKIIYMNLLTSCELMPHLAEIDRQANEMMETLVEQMKKEYGVTEELKVKDQMKWVGIMNNIRNSAREIVLEEIVYA